MGFADTGASRLRNNRKLIGPRSRMNDAHLKIGRSNKEKSSDKNKISNNKLEKFKLDLANKNKRENRKMLLSLISLIVIAILMVFLFLTFIKL